MEKPPLGIKPEFLWREERLTDLIDAIKRLPPIHVFTPRQMVCLGNWSNEITRHVGVLLKLREGKP